MPAAIIGTSVLTRNVNQDLEPQGECSQEGEMNSKEVKVTPEPERGTPFIFGHGWEIPRYEGVGGMITEW